MRNIRSVFLTHQNQEKWLEVSPHYSSSIWKQPYQFKLHYWKALQAKTLPSISTYDRAKFYGEVIKPVKRDAWNRNNDSPSTAAV